MKTRITQNIDGYDIIIGIGEAQIDPVNTHPKMVEKLILTDEYKAVDEKKKAMQPIAQAIIQAQRDFKSATSKADKNKFSYEYQKKIEEMKALENELAPLAEPLLQKQRELMQECAVYFQPKQGETIITDEESTAIAEAMSNAANDGNFVDITLKVVPDNRGKIAYKKSDKWYARQITKLGDTLKSGEKFELSESEMIEYSEQLNKERIAKLTTIEKQKEKDSIISNLAKQAAAMRSALEIQGDNKALEKSQAWYNKEVAKVQVLYL